MYHQNYWKKLSMSPLVHISKIINKSISLKLAFTPVYSNLQRSQRFTNKPFGNFIVVVDIENIWKGYFWSDQRLSFSPRSSFRQLVRASFERNDCFETYWSNPSRNRQNKVPFAFFRSVNSFYTWNYDVPFTMLKDHGIKNTLLDWFRNYLTQRPQYVPTTPQSRVYCAYLLIAVMATSAQLRLW